MSATHETVQAVISLLIETLEIQDRLPGLTAATPLFGSIPELDSLAVVELAAAIEERFGIVLDDSDFSEDVLETVGTLARFIEEQRS